MASLLFINAFRFVVIGLLFSAVPEWQNHLLMNGATSGWPGYFSTLRFNAVVLFLSYLLFGFLDRRYSLGRALCIQFTTCGMVGLLIEWVLIGNPPGSNALQYGMFVYWAGVFGAPSLFVSERARPVRPTLAYFMLASSLAMILASLVLFRMDPSKQFLLLFILASWVVVYSVLIGFFFRAVGYPAKFRLVLSVGLMLAIAEIVVPFPIDFVLVVVAVLGFYWYVLRYLPADRISRPRLDAAAG